MDSGTEPFHCMIRERTLVARKKKLRVSEKKTLLTKCALKCVLTEPSSL
jgi:hypothetical protein